VQVFSRSSKSLCSTLDHYKLKIYYLKGDANSQNGRHCSRVPIMTMGNTKCEGQHHHPVHLIHMEGIYRGLYCCPDLLSRTATATATGTGPIVPYCSLLCPIVKVRDSNKVTPPDFGDGCLSNSKRGACCMECVGCLAWCLYRASHGDQL
jgi:hypothetical protein